MDSAATNAKVMFKTFKKHFYNTMKIKLKNSIKLLSLLIFMSCGLLGQAQLLQYDICVYGETASGVSAAIQGARMGKKVVLISQNSHVGGTTTSGLTATDINRNTLIGGIAREFYRKVYEYYQKPEAWKNQDRESYFQSSLKRTFTGKNDSLKIQWVYESHMGEKIMVKMLKEAGVDLVFNERLLPDKGSVKKKRKSIRSIKMESGKEFSAAVFIDATYEGDLMAQAGVSYTVGRESNKQYKETLNGIRLNEVTGNEAASVDPYIEEGNPDSGLLPYIEPRLWAEEGSADKRVQAYCYRMTLTNDPANRISIEKPASYNPLWFEVLARELRLNPDKKLQQIITLTPMPNKKTDTNKLNFFGANYDYPEGNYAIREKIAQRHKDFALGMLWFLGNDARVPEHIRGEMREWGLPKDEFVENDHFPYQLYVREARRMIGKYVMTEYNCRTDRRVVAPYSIGLGTYMLDCHHVSRVIDPAGKLRLEGTIHNTRVSPYPIGYHAITPMASECDNLLVPVCLSASHVAYSSIRMEPVYMVLGQSAGAAAALSIDEKCSVQKLPYEALEAQLLKDQQILSSK